MCVRVPVPLLIWRSLSDPTQSAVELGPVFGVASGFAVLPIMTSSRASVSNHPWTTRKSSQLLWGLKYVCHDPIVLWLYVQHGSAST